MNTGIKDGKIVIDMAEAEEKWNALTKDQQYEMVMIMFQPILDRATNFHRALLQIQNADTADVDQLKQIAKDAMGDIK